MSTTANTISPQTHIDLRVPCTIDRIPEIVQGRAVEQIAACDYGMPQMPQMTAQGRLVRKHFNHGELWRSLRPRD